MKYKIPKHYNHRKSQDVLDDFNNTCVKTGVEIVSGKLSETLQEGFTQEILATKAKYEAIDKTVEDNKAEANAVQQELIQLYHKLGREIYNQDKAEQNVKTLRKRQLELDGEFNYAYQAEQRVEEEKGRIEASKAEKDEKDADRVTKKEKSMNDAEPV